MSGVIFIPSEVPFLHMDDTKLHIGQFSECLGFCRIFGAMCTFTIAVPSITKLKILVFLGFK